MEKERLYFALGAMTIILIALITKVPFFGTQHLYCGGLVTGYFVLPSFVNCTFWICWLMVILIMLGILIMIIVVRAATPFLSKGTDSLHYFGSISSLKHDDFCTKSVGPISVEDELSDLRTQVHQLSNGLCSKFSMLRTAGIFVYYSVYTFHPPFYINNLQFKIT